MATLLMGLVLAMLSRTATTDVNTTVLDAPPFSCPGIHNATGSRSMRMKGKLRSVTFVWFNEPTRAAAALLMTAIAADGYENLYLRQGPRDLCTDKKINDIDHRSTVAVSWVPQGENSCHVRIPSVGEAGGYSELRLHTVYTPPPIQYPFCVYAACSWNFFQNPSDLHKCGFLRPRGRLGKELLLIVLNATHEGLVLQCFKGSHTPVHVTTLKRTELAERVRKPTQPFLFVDYDLWSGEKGVQTMRLPTTCYRESNPGFRALDEYIPIYAPDIHAALQNFNPEAKYLREVLEMEERDPDKNVLRAACQWGREHRTAFRRWFPAHKSTYFIGVFLCQPDPNLDLTSLRALGNKLNLTQHSEKYYMKLELRSLNCSDTEELKKSIEKFKSSRFYYTMIGIVTNARDTRGAAKEADRYYLPMVMAREAEAPGVGGTRVANGGEKHIASALRGLLQHAGWSRFAFFADDTHATSVLRNLLAGFTVKYVDTSKMDERGMVDALKELKPQHPWIIFMRLEPTRGVSLLRAANILKMTAAYGYVWVACAGPVPSTNVSHFAVSFWRPDVEPSAGLSIEAAIATELVKEYSARDTAPLFNAILTLRRGFQLFYDNHPDYRKDLHVRDTIRLFWQDYDKSPAEGVGGTLRYEGGVLQNSTVYLEWCDAASPNVSVSCRPKGEWRDGNWRRLLPLFTETYTSPPTDGTRRCVWRGGDPYYITCYDFAIGVIICAAAALVGTAAYARLSYRRELIRRETKILQQLQQWKERAAGSLATYLVDRAALHFNGRLGEGRFGCVRFALLRDGTAPPQPVAVKALRENAAPTEESEFLREASVLASLEHENVIGFVGVCAGDGPPLVLMEHAFFGDLLRYLRARRHLVETEAPITNTNEECLAPEEAVHVSPAALTRLAREAASALSYLASRGIVHRDVRASNCLIDARRTLKLSDFGLARQVSDSPGDDAEYACQRRGFFPVLWMAPESLKLGVFSAASDVWSFGVLVMELITLGARPYGRWAPLRVLQFVSDGGQPPLPADASRQSRALAELCWRRRTEQRPSAAELVAYLTTHENALRPALCQTEPEVTDTDSGFSGSPYNERERPFGFTPSPRLPRPSFPV